MSNNKFRQQIHSIIGMMFVGSVALGAILLMLNFADFDNPIAEMMIAHATLE